MNQANTDYPEIKLFIYMDSDAVIDREYVNVSVIAKVTEIQGLLQVLILFFSRHMRVDAHNEFFLPSSTHIYSGIQRKNQWYLIKMVLVGGVLS